MGCLKREANGKLTFKLPSHTNNFICYIVTDWFCDVPVVSYVGHKCNRWSDGLHFNYDTTTVCNWQENVKQCRIKCGKSIAQLLLYVIFYT